MLAINSLIKPAKRNFCCYALTGLIHTVSFVTIGKSE